MLTLPYPPSINHYWRNFRGRMVISREGRAYREDVRALLATAGQGGEPPKDGPIAPAMGAFPPDRWSGAFLHPEGNPVGDMLECDSCGKSVRRSAPTQRYCRSCSEERDLARKRNWARSHPPDDNARRTRVAASRGRRERAREAGKQLNRDYCRSIEWAVTEVPLLWRARAAVPFSYAASKNHIYALNKRGHVALRRETRQMRDRLTRELRLALQGRRIAHNKVWIDILVQKPDHRGDAVNVVDLVCDAVKDAIPVDDRWFCIRCLDWEVCKDGGQLIVGIGQESDADCQVCSYCGRIRPLTEFNVASNRPLGVGRECKECRRQGRLLANPENN